MTEHQRLKQAMVNLKRELRQAARRERTRAEARRNDGTSTINVSHRVNQVVVANVGGEGATHYASSNQTAPIVQRGAAGQEAGAPDERGA